MSCQVKMGNKNRTQTESKGEREKRPHANTFTVTENSDNGNALKVPSVIWPICDANNESTIGPTIVFSQSLKFSNADLSFVLSFLLFFFARAMFNQIYVKHSILVCLLEECLCEKLLKENGFWCKNTSQRSSTKRPMNVLSNIHVYGTI